MRLRGVFFRTFDEGIECSCGVVYDLREFALDCYLQDHPWLEIVWADLEEHNDVPVLR